MRHGFANKKLNRTSEHRKALLKNMLNSLIKYEQIKTTLPKAKFLKPQADKIITLGKRDTLHNTKALVSQLQDIKSANKVKKTLSKRYEKRTGGYTIIIKAKKICYYHLVPIAQLPWEYHCKNHQSFVPLIIITK